MRGEIKFALSLAGVPAKTIDDIDKALPAAARLVDAYQKLEPELAKVVPDLNTVAPVLGEVIKFIRGERT